MLRSFLRCEDIALNDTEECTLHFEKSQSDRAAFWKRHPSTRKGKSQGPSSRRCGLKPWKRKHSLSWPLVAAWTAWGWIELHVMALKNEPIFQCDNQLQNSVSLSTFFGCRFCTMQKATKAMSWVSFCVPILGERDIKYTHVHTYINTHMHTYNARIIIKCLTNI